jgi:AAA domain, putative AbiEii toxin, Type IV TA system
MRNTSTGDDVAAGRTSRNLRTGRCGWSGSSGLSTILWAIDNGTAPLLLEEPELSLHRDVIRQLPRLVTQAAQRSGRQVVISTHAEEMLSDRGIDPSEILLLEPSEHESKVVVGSDRPELTNAARARLPLGRIVTGLTKPKDIDQLSLPGTE